MVPRRAVRPTSRTPGQTGDRRQPTLRLSPDLIISLSGWGRILCCSGSPEPPTDGRTGPTWGTRSRVPTVDQPGAEGRATPAHLCSRRPSASALSPLSASPVAVPLRRRSPLPLRRRRSSSPASAGTPARPTSTTGAAQTAVPAEHKTAERSGPKAVRSAESCGGSDSLSNAQGDGVSAVATRSSTRAAPHTITTAAQKPPTVSVG